MADATLSDIVEEVSSEDGVRTVKVEITHKHEERSSGVTWAIGLGIVLISVSYTHLTLPTKRIV